MHWEFPTLFMQMSPFFEENQDRAIHIKEVIGMCGTTTHQLLNPQKCSIQFGACCTNETEHEVHQVLHLQNMDFEAKYLVLATLKVREFD